MLTQQQAQAELEELLRELEQQELEQEYELLESFAFEN